MALRLNPRSEPSAKSHFIRACETREMSSTGLTPKLFDALDPYVIGPATHASAAATLRAAADVLDAEFGGYNVPS